jgi:AbrB family looped-hinge helix DNA binding protein
MNTITLSNDYQLTIPENMRETIGLKAGTSFEVFPYNNRIELIPISPIKKLRGIFKGIDTTIVRDDDRV